MDGIIDNIDILSYIYSSSMNNYIYGMGETTIEDMLKVVECLTKELKTEPKTAEWYWKANNYIEIEDKEFIEKYQKLIDALDDLDDINEIYTNADL